MRKLKLKSVSKDASVSTIINGILHKYVTWDQFVNDTGFIFLQKPFL